MSIDVDPDWWKTMFDEIYLITDARSVCNETLTCREVDVICELLPLNSGHRILDRSAGQDVRQHEGRFAEQHEHLAGEDPDQNVRSHEWIAQAPAREPGPGNQGVWPIAPDERLDRDIDQPDCHQPDYDFDTSHENVALPDISDHPDHKQRRCQCQSATTIETVAS